MEKICKHCGNKFIKVTKESINNWNARKYCCRDCGYKFRKGKVGPNKDKKFSKEHIRKLSESHKGLTTWSKGIKMSLESRLKMSISRKGKKLSTETRKKMSLVAIGRTVSEETKQKIRIGNWKCEGGITSINKLERVRFRHSMQKQVLERDNYTCQMCGKRGGTLQVDHIQPWKNFIELRFSMDNCRTLCMDCHYLITFGKPKPQGLVWGHNFKNMEVSN